MRSSMSKGLRHRALSRTASVVLIVLLIVIGITGFFVYDMSSLPPATSSSNNLTCSVTRNNASTVSFQVNGNSLSLNISKSITLFLNSCELDQFNRNTPVKCGICANGIGTFEYNSNELKLNATISNQSPQQLQKGSLNLTISGTFDFILLSGPNIVQVNGQNMSYASTPQCYEGYYNTSIVQTDCFALGSASTLTILNFTEISPIENMVLLINSSRIAVP